MKESYAESYCKACEVVEKEGEVQFKRPLSAKEKLLIRNAGSLRMLELIKESLMESPEKALKFLLDSEEVFLKTRDSFFRQINEVVAFLLNRPLKYEDLASLSRLDTIAAGLVLHELLGQTDLSEREAFFQKATSMPGPGKLA